MNRGFVVAVGGAAILIAGLSGCSSEEKSETSEKRLRLPQRRARARSQSTAQDQAVQGTVVCSTMGENVNIAIGDATTGIGAVVGTGDSPVVHSVGLGNVNGVTLGIPGERGPGRGQGREGRQHLQDFRHRGGRRHGEPAAASEQALRDRGQLPVAGTVLRHGGVPRGAAVLYAGFTATYAKVGGVSAHHLAHLLGVAAVTTGALLAAPIPVAAAEPCTDVEVVFARGTFEPPGFGGIGQSFVDAFR